MAQRIKITGYIPVSDLEDEHVDLDHPSGLSEDGQLEVTTMDGGGNGFHIYDLEDINTELVDE